MAKTKVVRSALGSLIQTGQYLAKDIPAYANSTLNQKLGINADIDLAAGEIPSVKYLAIGNGGHDFIVGANGRPKWDTVLHEPRHTALYNQLPFVLRLPANDLPSADRRKYRLRRMETHGGVQYVAYYLRVLDVSQTAPILELRHIEDGITTASAYSPTIEDLNPVPPVISTGSLVTATADYVASTAKVPFVMTPSEVTEFMDAVRIIEGEDGYAIISEVATVSGVDRAVQGTFFGQSVSYTEAIRAQITAFISSAWVMESQTDGITMNIDVGNVEPLVSAG